MTKRWPIGLTALLGSLSWAASGDANRDASVRTAGDLELGEYLSSECTTCHQTSGESNGIPAIGGWPATFMVMVLEQYRDGERQNPIMRSVVQSLSDEEIAALAAWFERIGVPGPAPK